LGHPVATVEVDVDHLAELLRRLFRAGHRGALACVVDEDVNASKVLHGRIDHTLRVLGPRNICGHDERAAAALLDDHTCLFESVGSASCEDEVRSRLRKRGGEGDAQPGGRAGNDGDLVVEPEAVEH
jgi:hypothetical protein